MKHPWNHHEYYSSEVGQVVKEEGGEWIARVYVNQNLARLSERFASAEVAMMAVERTWEREKKRNAYRI